MKKLIPATFWLLTALTCGQAWAQAEPSGGSAPQASTSAGQVVSIVSVYVNPTKQQEFQNFYKQQYAAQSKHLDGLMESYLLLPATGDTSAPVKHVTVWRDRAAYDAFLQKVTSGEHPVGAKTNYGYGEGMYVRRPIYELYLVEQHKVNAPVVTDAAKN
ncbi:MULTISPECIES: hypothetical protein [Pseudomonas]|uniref:ABM domain-containing protein n=1 Tax=Pseudomonas fluorescens TaxID=294 RepID=A0A0N9W8S4_PSEFL|nr:MULTISPECIES: hypothetical protein [Pseudomonas]ALI10213.1 hypothetical protein AO356_26495 [Pseudomonas fluorescens]POA11567.1 antibiotic biosynthesis monooxygenase [Pseudomonas sp. MPBD7-1]